jgi:hypothetical protein
VELMKPCFDGWFLVMAELEVSVCWAFSLLARWIGFEEFDSHERIREEATMNR